MINTTSTQFLEMTPELEVYLHSSPNEGAQLSENTMSNANLHSCPVVVQRVCDSSEVNLPLHSHSFLEILYCRQASRVEYLVNTNRYRLQPGDIVLLPPDTPHRTIFSKEMDGPFVRDILWFRKDVFPYLGMETSKTFQRNQSSSYLLRTTGSKYSHIGDLFQNALEESQMQALHWDKGVLSYGILALVEIGRALLDKSTLSVAEEPPQLFDRIIRYIEDKLNQKITLEETAKFFYISKSTVTRVFQKHTGTSFYRYVTQRRLIAAKARILSGEALESVGESVGFSDYPTFYRAFKQEYGISPSQFRREQKANI